MGWDSQRTGPWGLLIFPPAHQEPLKKTLLSTWLLSDFIICPALSGLPDITFSCHPLWRIGKVPKELQARLHVKQGNWLETWTLCIGNSSEPYMIAFSFL